MAHGFSPVHELKYKAGFKHFDYVNPNAPKGGTLRVSAIGTFYSLNTLKWPGTTPRSAAQKFSFRDLVYDSLLEEATDEIAAYYGRLASGVEVADDFSWVRFRINEKARWHDGKPVLASDVLFTISTLQRQGPPFYRQVLRGIKVIVENDRTVLIKAARKNNRDFVNLVGSVPIHPEHFWKTARLDKANMDIPLGSGPYRVRAAKPGVSITFERVKDYWGRTLPVNKGRYNFDQVKVIYYRDSSIAMEAFLAGEYDLRIETNPLRWTSAYPKPADKTKNISRIVVAGRKAGDLYGLVFNLRQPRFRDVRVRRAISLVYDFNWNNKNLFHGLFQPVNSYYASTSMQARGPLTQAEKTVLGETISTLPKAALSQPGPKPRSAYRSEREVLSEAAKLLREAGFKVKNGRRINPATGKPVVISVLYTRTQIERVLAPMARALEKLGIALEYRLGEGASASKMILDHEFDVVLLTQWSPSVMPGNSERFLWGSRFADRKGSYALSGAKDKALDKAIAAMNAARSKDQLQVAARTFDRVLRWRQYMLPLWRKSDTWIAWHKGFAHPDLSKTYTIGVIDLWWKKPNQVQKSTSKTKSAISGDS